MGMILSTVSWGDFILVESIGPLLAVLHFFLFLRWLWDIDDDDDGVVGDERFRNNTIYYQLTNHILADRLQQDVYYD